MIKVNVKYENNKISEISIVGHAMFAEKGKDIVCSAASSIFITTVNGILSFDENAISSDTKNNGLVLKINKHDDITDKLIMNMLDLFKDLEKEYKENIKIQ